LIGNKLSKEANKFLRKLWQQHQNVVSGLIAVKVGHPADKYKYQRFLYRGLLQFVI